MSFRQPFRAVPIKHGKRYQRKAKRAQWRQTLRFLGGAALFGAVAGTASLAATPGGFDAIGNKIKPIAISMGLVRSRAPQVGDVWPSCNAARAAGTAPIYVGEPGYREGMDGDGDGIACEPYRG